MCTYQKNMASGNSNILSIETKPTIKINGDINISVHKKVVEEFHLPRPISTFRGRETEFECLKSFFKCNIKIVVISGLPGIGKTELAKQFAIRCKNVRYVDKIIWINADTKKDIETSFKDLSRVLNMSPENIVTNIYKRFRNYKTLFIFDNAQNLHSLFEYLPPESETNFYCLITSPFKDWGDKIQYIVLEPLTLEAAVEVFRANLTTYYKEEDHECYKELAIIFDRIPLALQIGACYVRQLIRYIGKEFILRKYIQSISKDEEEIFTEKMPYFSPNSYKHSIYGAISISLRKISDEYDLITSDLSLNILFVCSYLKEDKIFFEILSEILPFTAVQLNKNDYKYHDKLRNALCRLNNFSFIKYDKNQIHIHRIIQKYLRFHLNNNETYMKDKCYTACLQFLFENENPFACVHQSTILMYADDNADIFCNTYLKYVHKINDIKSIKTFENIPKYLVKFGCIKCLKKILENTNISTENIVILPSLLHYSALYEKVDILNLLQEYYIEHNVDIKKMKFNLYASRPVVKGIEEMTSVEILQLKTTFNDINLTNDYNSDVAEKIDRKKLKFCKYD